MIDSTAKHFLYDYTSRDALTTNTVEMGFHPETQNGSVRQRPFLGSTLYQDDTWFAWSYQSETRALEGAQYSPNEQRCAHWWQSCVEPPSLRVLLAR